MFWRILLQLFGASRGRAAVALIALASGAAVTTALLNLDWDADRKVSAEFRTLGANVTIAPESGAPLQIGNVPYLTLEAHRANSPKEDSLASPLLNESQVADAIKALDSLHAAAAPYLYVIASANTGNTQSESQVRVILAGTWLDEMRQLAPWWKIAGQTIADRNDSERCYVGRNVARQLNVEPGSRVELSDTGLGGNGGASLAVAGVIDSGGQEDNQIIANLAVVQKLSGQVGRVGVVQASIPGTSREIEAAITQLLPALPSVDIRPIPQITQAESRLLPRIRGLIFFMVALILVLTVLCVFASMAALAMERRRDVGLMKAIGGSMSRIVTIFLTEAGALGLAGALIGYAAGIFLSRWIGERAFHTTINARIEVLPLVIALMVGVALAGALPLRLLGRVRPAEILRGE